MEGVQTLSCHSSGISGHGNIHFWLNEPLRVEHFYPCLKPRQEGALLSLAASVKPLGTLNSFILKLITRRSDSQTWQYVDSHYRVNRWSKVTHTLRTLRLHFCKRYRLDRDRLLGKLLTTSPIRITFFNRSINFFLSNSSSYPALLTRYFSTNFPFVIWIQRYATQNTIRCPSLSLPPR